MNPFAASSTSTAGCSKLALTVSRPHAEDVVQERFFLKLMTAHPHFRDEGHMKSLAHPRHP